MFVPDTVGTTCAIGDLERHLVPALERLTRSPSCGRPFVLVSAAEGSPFVQFAGSDQEPILCDVPLVEQRLARRFPVDGSEPTAFGIVWRGVTPARGAALALVLLRDGFGVYGQVEIVEGVTFPGTGGVA